MTPWCDDLVCSWRRLLADRHSLPFPWTLSLHRQWCPSASHHPLTFLFLPALTFPLPFPFLSLGLSLRRPQCPSASHHSFPSHSLGRLGVSPNYKTDQCKPEAMQSTAKAQVHLCSLCQTRVPLRTHTQGSEVPGSGGGYCTHKRTHNVPMARKNGGKWGKMGGNGEKWGGNGEKWGKIRKLGWCNWSPFPPFPPHFLPIFPHFPPFYPIFPHFSSGAFTNAPPPPQPCCQPKP